VTPHGGWVGDWSPGIGDPTIVGWVAVVAYLVAAYVSYLAFKIERFRAGRPAEGRAAFLDGLRWLMRGLAGGQRLRGVPDKEKVPALWAGLALMLLLLGINKQLDLQSLLTEIGRIAARDEGWYEARRTVQVVFILLLLVTGAWALRALWRIARGHLAQMRMALFGALGLVAFVAIRAASFHHVDLLIGTEVAGVDLNAWLEIGAITVIAVGAARQIGVGRSSPVPPPPAPPRARPAPPRSGGRS
jgi:hypothetical protein